MSKRYNLRLPAGIAHVLDQLADRFGSKPTTYAAFLIQKHIQGLIETDSLPEGIALLQSAEGVDFLDDNPLDGLLVKLVDGKSIDDTDIAEAAVHTTISVDELKALCDRIKRGNCHETPIR